MDKKVRQVALLYSATFLGAVLNFIASKVNTDYLLPAEYGDVRYVLNFIQLVSWVVLFGWYMSGSRLLALSDDKKYSARIRGTLIVCLGVSALILMLTVLVVGMAHAGNTELRHLFFIAIPVAAYPLLTNYMNTTAQGDNHIGRLALARVLPVLCYIPIAILLYRLYGADSRKVILLHWGICSLVMVLIIISTGPAFKELRPVFSALRDENRSYGIKLYWGSLAMVATNYLAGVTLGWFNDDNSNVGFYTLALSLAQPLSYLPGIVGTTYFRHFTRESRIPGKVFIITLIITVVSCLGFILLIKPVVSLYDESYSIVARYAALLAIGFSIHGIGDMINRYLGSHGQGSTIRNCSFACGAVKIAGSLLFVWLWNVNGAVLTLILSSAVYTLSLYVGYRSFIRGK